MSWNFQEIKESIEIEAQGLNTPQELEAFRIKYVGRKGLIPKIYASLATATKEEKPLIGKNTNEIKSRINQILVEKTSILQEKQKSKQSSKEDLTLPGILKPVGHKHLITQTIEEICSIFEGLGFVIQEGPEIETEFNNFSALNIPEDHPSRDGFDTFYLDQKDPSQKNVNLLLRSHTSPGQSRIMKKYDPPLAVIIPGTVYRPDAVDASHSFMFHQIEGLLVDKDVNFSQLKGLLTAFCKKFFGDNIKMRFRPHYFPFTEPSAEVDISWEKGKKDWLEIMGCGMVHPQVFQAVGYKKGKYTGLAFGLGVERIAMLKHGIKDIRVLFENDNRFLNQF